MTDDTDLRVLAQRCHDHLELIHVVPYFAPDCAAAYEALGLHPLLAYFPARGAALGPVGPAVVGATFYVFNPALISMVLPAAWDITTPDQVLEAKHSSLLVAFTRELGTPDVTEALELARTACEGLSPEGRTLYAAYAALPWPEDPVLALWHATTLLREHRGDGHLMALTLAGLDPVEALSLHGRVAGMTGFLKATRGWSDEDWAAAEQRLLARGIVDADGAVTEAGATFKAGIESMTLDLAMPGWSHLGADGAARLLELVRPLVATLKASPLYPSSIRRSAAS